MEQRYSWCAGCRFALAVLAVAYCGPAGAEMQDPRDQAITVIIEGLKSSLTRFEECSFEINVSEKRFVEDESGHLGVVQLDPRRQIYYRKGEKYYFWHNGGGYTSSTKDKESGTYEGAYDTGRYVELAHHFRSMYVFAEPNKGMTRPIDPLVYLGETVLTHLQDHPGKIPGTTNRIVTPETLYGEECVVIETKYTSGSVLRDWIDQHHSFLPRKMESYIIDGDTGELKLWWRTEIPEIQETLPGVWTPAHVVSEGAIGVSGSHLVRDITFDKIDITDSVPESTFTLERPEGYYLHDYILGLHIQPELVQDEAAHVSDVLNATDESKISPRELGNESKSALEETIETSSARLVFAEPRPTVGRRRISWALLSSFAVIGALGIIVILVFRAERRQRGGAR